MDKNRTFLREKMFCQNHLLWLEILRGFWFQPCSLCYTPFSFPPPPPPRERSDKTVFLNHRFFFQLAAGPLGVDNLVFSPTHNIGCLFGIFLMDVLVALQRCTASLHQKPPSRCHQVEMLYLHLMRNAAAAQQTGGCFFCC